VYLLGVLVVSTVWGFGLSAATSVASALAFDYFEIGRAPSSSVFDDIAVIGVFVMVTLIANSLAFLVRARAVEADLRRGEASEAVTNFGRSQNCSPRCDGSRTRSLAAPPRPRCSAR